MFPGRAHYVLPAVTAPSTSKCFMVPVPNDPQHIAAFMGQIYNLAWSRTWADDPTHQAADVARVWQEIFDGLQECEMVNIRLKPTDFCTIQLTTDGGVTWTDVADLSDCANAAVVAGIDDAINDGRLAPGGTVPGVPSPTPGQCYDYDVQLSGNERWIAPVPLDQGDIITVTIARGAWYDGDALNQTWRCPDGNSFVLGGCIDSHATDAGDPAPTIDHMRLIGNIATETAPFFDLYNAVYNVGQLGPSDLFMQANDGVLADNQGTVTFHVQICKAGWIHTFDFAANDGGWTPDVYSSQNCAVYSAGNGWGTYDLTQPGGTCYRIIALNKALSSREIIRLSIVYDRTAGSGDPGIMLRASLDSTHVIDLNESQIISGLDVMATWNGHQAGVTLIDLNQLVASFTEAGHTCAFSGSALVKKIIIAGFGTDPF